MYSRFTVQSCGLLWGFLQFSVYFLTHLCHSQVTFRNPIRYGLKKELFIAPEGLYSGQAVYAGKKATLSIGNIKPVGEMPEGAIICNVEEVCP